MFAESVLVKKKNNKIFVFQEREGKMVIPTKHRNLSLLLRLPVLAKTSADFFASCENQRHHPLFCFSFLPLVPNYQILFYFVFLPAVLAGNLSFQA